MSKPVIIIAAALLLAVVPAAVSAQSVPPHRIAGKAYIDGQLASAGARVEAFIGSRRVADATVNSEGQYLLEVARPSGSRTITFRVDGYEARETAIWTQGKISYPFNLRSGGGSRPVAEVFASLIGDGSLVVLWRYDNAAQSWSSFDPRPELAPFNDLTEVNSRDIVWVQVLRNREFQGATLYEGWNIITLR